METKDKLSIEDQVDYLQQEKGIGLGSITRESMVGYLSNHTDFFELKVYAKLFEKREKELNAGKYINLTCEKLIELSKLDWYLRKLLLTITLPIEPFHEAFLSQRMYGKSFRRWIHNHSGFLE